jgi:hypothetical protein
MHCVHENTTLRGQTRPIKRKNLHCRGVLGGFVAQLDIVGCVLASQQTRLNTDSGTFVTALVVACMHLRVRKLISGTMECW